MFNINNLRIQLPNHLYKSGIPIISYPYIVITLSIKNWMNGFFDNMTEATCLLKIFILQSNTTAILD